MTMTAPAAGSLSLDGRVYPLGPQPSLSIGSGPGDDLVVEHPLVTPRHLTLDWCDDAWVLAAASGAPVLASGEPVTRLAVSGSAQVQLGHPVTGPTLVVVLAGAHPVPPECAGPAPGPRYAAAPAAPAAPAPIAAGDRRVPAPIRLTGVQTLGRTAYNDIVVDDVLVSRTHARIVAHPHGLTIEDLGSANGTFVDGRRIRLARLAEGSVVTVGNTDFAVTGGSLVPAPAPARGRGLEVSGVSLVVDRDKELLHEVGFSAAPGTLTAVIGPSGAGKSTLARVVAGLTAPSGGRVVFDGRDVHADADLLRTRIGMVPQQDVIHTRLTLRQALGYAAEIRLPDDLPRAERDAVIAGVLDELALTPHLDTRIDALSGGQRKRCSVAMELLTGPSLLLLDEPTSGLDPALDRQVMAALRRLADAGRVVLVVTHSLSYLDLCDRVLLLAPGGRTAFHGRPADIPAALGSDDWAQIFARVAAEPAEVYARHLQRTGGARRRVPPPAAAPAPAEPARRASARRQAATVARRQLRLIRADRGYLISLAVMPVVLGLISLVIPGAHGFSGPNLGPEDPGEGVQLLVVLIIGAVFMGAATTVRDLVAERDVYHRERAVGLRPGAYLTAKVGVFSAVAVAQATVMVTLTFAAKGLPSGGVFGVAPIGLLLAVAALAVVSALIGLAISVTVRSSEQTMPPLVILVIVQLVFCGGLFRLSAPVVSQLQALMPAHWGFAGAAMAVDLRANSPLAPQGEGMNLWDPEPLNALLAGSCLLLTATVLTGYVGVRLAAIR